MLRVPARGSDQLKLRLVFKAGTIWVHWLVQTDAWRVFGVERVQVISVDSIVNDAATH